MTIRVLIIEDNVIYAQGLSKALEESDGISGVYLASNLDSAIDIINRRLPNIVIVNVTSKLRGKEGRAYAGISLIEYICRNYKSISVLAMSSSEDSDWAIRSIIAGAHGFIQKDAHPIEFLFVVNRLVKGGGAILSSKRLNVIYGNLFSSVLTSREKEVINLMAKGYTNTEIANKLGISVGTVRTHVTNILQKLNVHSRRDAVREAERRGWLD